MNQLVSKNYLQNKTAVPLILSLRSNLLLCVFVVVCLLRFRLSHFIASAAVTIKWCHTVAVERAATMCVYFSVLSSGSRLQSVFVKCERFCFAAKNHSILTLNRIPFSLVCAYRIKKKKHSNYSHIETK